MTALDRLIEAVEAGTGGNYSEWDALSIATDNGLPIFAIDEAANGSFDAALAIKGALLPEHEWMAGGPEPDFAVLHLEGEDIADDMYHTATTPARALLLATLKAYREKQDA